ncbi:GPH family glycoside/pentoside/hexuronide:cation symporter [Virgibacillus halotolerans]|uniref:MFS transporter n=1 Tax=Virgibacillus halotolerans TaxID=1071053 RepID=UPI001961243A|nr:MFS transporter [Virgibacillus halotolerans]MBM7599044.1 GPH family glycoside/pentoside/hexuronide:cation symporter [Virgibacillus halotolerans]
MSKNLKQEQVNLALMNSKLRPFGIRDKIGYMFGDVADSLFFMLVSTYLMVFYTDVYGLNAGFVGVLFMLAKIWEAFTDLLWGRFVDTRKPSKNGQFKPWIFRMSFPLIISGILLFVHIPGMSDGFYLAYAFVSYFLFMALFSTISIPYGAMASVITSDPIQRTSLSTYRSLGLTIANLVVTVLGPILLFVDNHADANRFFMTALLFGILAFASYMACYNMSTERISAPKNQEKDIKRTLKSVLTNRPLLTVFAFTLVFLSVLMFFGTINVYLYKNYFESTAALSVVGAIQALSVIAIMPMIQPLVKKYGKKEITAFSLSVGALAYLTLYLLPKLGVIPFTIILTFGLIGMAVFQLLMWAFVTDVIDYHEYLTGLREDGTIYSFYSAARRIGQGIATGLGGVLIGIVGYNGNLESQTRDTLDGIRMLATLVPAVGLIIMVILLAFVYPLNKKRTNQLAIDLNEKRKTKH